MPVIISRNRILSLIQIRYVITFLRLYFLRPALQFFRHWFRERHISRMAIAAFTNSWFCQGTIFLLFPGSLILSDVICQLLKIFFRTVTLSDLGYIHPTVGPGSFYETGGVSDIVYDKMDVPGPLGSSFNVSDPEKLSSSFPINLS